MTTTATLLENARKRGFARLGEEGLREWLLELVAAGIAVEVAPDEWQLTEVGRARFASVGAMTLGQTGGAGSSLARSDKTP